MVKKEREDNCVREKWKRKNKNKKKMDHRGYTRIMFSIYSIPLKRSR